MNQMLIEVDGLWKKFRRGELHDSLRDFIPALGRRIVSGRTTSSELGSRDFWALKDLSFDVRRGEALGVIGPNGAGKSTLMKVLTRILRPNRGRVSVHGRLGALIEVAAGFHQDLTGRENIFLNGTILGMRRREIARRLEEIVEFSGIGAAIDTPVKRYSSGMLARLGFSVAAHLDPDVLLVDEVLSVGDAAFRNKCIRHMQKLIASDVGVVFISHNLEQVRQLCDRCLLLENGAPIFLGDVDEACQRYLAVLQSTASTCENDRADLGGQSGGRLLGLRMLDDNGKSTLAARSAHPLHVQIGYELTRTFDAIALQVEFWAPDRGHITTCATVQTGAQIGSTAGEHLATLRIKQLALAEGHFLIGVRLVDLDRNRILDSHDQRYPVEVAGPHIADGCIYLDHEWIADVSAVEQGIEQSRRSNAGKCAIQK